MYRPVTVVQLRRDIWRTLGEKKKNSSIAGRKQHRLAVGLDENGATIRNIGGNLIKVGRRGTTRRLRDAFGGCA